MSSSLKFNYLKYSDAKTPEDLKQIDLVNGQAVQTLLKMIVQLNREKSTLVKENNRLSRVKKIDSKKRKKSNSDDDVEVEDAKTIMMNLKKLEKVGVTTTKPEIYMPLLVMFETSENKSVYIIVKNIFDSETEKMDIRGAVLGTSFPKIKNHMMMNYWGELYILNAPSERKFNNLEECRNICKKMFPSIDFMQIKKMENLIIILNNERYQSLNWFIETNRAADEFNAGCIGLNREQLIECKSSAAKQPDARVFSEAYIRETYIREPTVP
jgi:hypothetical protein